MSKLTDESMVVVAVLYFGSQWRKTRERTGAEQREAGFL
jgi:hypothetical protein